MGVALHGRQHAGADPPRASKLLLACFYLLGMGVVCNWVALLQCQDYLGPLFTAYSPSRVLTAAYAALDLLAQSLLFFFGHRLWANKRSRMVVGYAACTAVTAALPLLDVYLLDKAAAAVGTQNATAAYFAAWTCYSLITGASSAIIGSVTYAQAAVYGASYCQAFVCGRAASGLSCILVRVITKATLPDSPAGLRQSTLIFLGITSLIVMACVVVASWLPAEAPGRAAAATPVSCTPTLATVSKQDAWQHHPANSTPTAASALHEPLLSTAAAEHEQQQEQQQHQDMDVMALQPPQGLDAAQSAAAVPVQEHGAEPHWCAVVDDAAEASKHDTTAAAAAAAALQELPRHLTCKTVSPMVSLEDGISSAVYSAVSPVAAAASPTAAAWEPFGWQPPSASVAAAAAAAGELSAFHSSFLNARSFASPGVQSPFSGFSTYWHSGKHCSALPLLSQHALQTQHTPSSVLWTPPGQSLSSFQQQQQLVAEGSSLAISCWAALRRMHCYVTAMGISFFVPCFIFPAMLSPEAGSWPAVGTWWTIMLVFAFQSGAVVGSALPLYQLRRPKLSISLLAWGQWVLVPATVAALTLHGGPLVLLAITFCSMVYGYHVASLVFWLACEGLAAAADVELVQGLLVLVLTAARLAGLLMAWLWN